MSLLKISWLGDNALCNSGDGDRGDGDASAVEFVVARSCTPSQSNEGGGNEHGRQR